MEALHLIRQVQEQHKDKLILTGLAALQYPTVQTHQLTFFNPGGGKKEYYVNRYHILIRRAPTGRADVREHLLFISRHIELYANEMDLLKPVIAEIDLEEFAQHDRAWRLFAYLKHHLLAEPVPPKKTIGRRYIDLGDIHSPHTIKDKTLHIRDALLIPAYLKKTPWTPRIDTIPDRTQLEAILKANSEYFKTREIRPLFNRFARYASKLESAASAKIEGYDARVEMESLSTRVQKKMQSNIALRANLNMDNLHRDLPNLIKTALSLDLLLSVQEAIVKDTWKNKGERTDKTPGMLRPFDEVIVDRSSIDRENIIYIAPKHEDVEILIRELIDFYHSSRNTLHPLELAAIFKCQLTVIHPFGDGNGRLARWCFLYILMREGLINNVHQAPISHIFLEHKNRYYDELLKVDSSIMDHVTCDIDNTTKRYHAHYENVDIYRNLDYSSWISYTYEAFASALSFSIEEHDVFERTQNIYESLKKKAGIDFTPNQQHSVLRAIDIGLRHEWGKKTEQRLANNGLTTEQVHLLRDLTVTTT